MLVVVQLDYVLFQFSNEAHLEATFDPVLKIENSC